MVILAVDTWHGTSIMLGVAIVLENSMSTAAKEYFFKIFSPEKHSETMVIPSSFVKSRGLGRRTIPKDIILRNVSGDTEDPHLEDYEFDPQMYIQHENPYFEAKLYKNRPNELHVPANILRDTSLTFPEEIILSRCLCFQSEDTQRKESRKNHCGFSRQTQMYSKVTKVSEWQDGRGKTK
ncbi:uncharacterized protein HKW66_Vig0130740 [Vigna angularis]|uniref:Uncharacterized protein n=1 Tax=Phaseolus angularis TaxID=3914 RepID=A0A8T0K645_PHAAN|nr:uncharacterized protein HKW66_Vig0130740 [Vigna angularis]